MFSVGLDCPINTPSHKANCIIAMKVWPGWPVMNDMYSSRPNVHTNLFGYTSAACISHLVLWYLGEVYAHISSELSYLLRAKLLARGVGFAAKKFSAAVASSE